MVIEIKKYRCPHCGKEGQDFKGMPCKACHKLKIRLGVLKMTVAEEKDVVKKNQMIAEIQEIQKTIKK